jgi:hypothetical protein
VDVVRPAPWQRQHDAQEAVAEILHARSRHGAGLYGTRAA